MAQPLIYHNSPLADYLLNNVPNELSIPFPISNSNTINHSSSPSSSPSPSPSPSPNNINFTFPFPENLNHLSERLKYIICSSCLLNPNLSPAFYDSQLSSTLISSSFVPPSPPSLNPPPSPLRFLSSLLSTFPPFPPHPRRLLALSALIFLIGYHLSLSWALFSLLFLALSFFPRFPSRLLQILPPYQLPSRSSRLNLHSQLVSATAELVHKTQALDLRISRGFGAVKEVECVALGLGLSNPMPPISRLETASFPLAGSSYSPSPSPSSPFSPSLPPLRPQISLHAMGLRKVLQRVLDQARHEYERAALELESVIDSPLLNPASTQPGSSPSPLASLMEMYACSRESVSEPHIARQRSVSDRLRRQTWRASLHARLSDSPASPLSPQDVRFTREQFFTPRSSKRATWQPIASPSRCLSDSHSIIDDHKFIPLRPHSRPNSIYSTPPAHQLGHASPRRANPTISPVLVSDFARQQATPRPRPASYYATTRTPIQSASPLPGSRRSSILGSLAGRSKPRPASMMANSSCGLSSTSPYYQPSSSPGIFLNAPSSPCSEHHGDMALQPDEPEPAPPFSLRALQNTFERMDISRKRLLCCLLALDFGPDTPAGARILQETVDSVRDMIKTVDGLSLELIAGMSAEFGPGSFEGGVTARGQTEKETGDVVDQEVRDFGPPVPPAEVKAKRLGELMGQLEAMDLALRSISAKMQVCVEELGRDGLDGGSGATRAVEVHDSIRADLEMVAREWDASRSKLRSVVEGERSLKVGANRLRPTSLDSSEGGASTSTSGWSGVASSVVSSEVLTPVEEYGVVRDVAGDGEQSGAMEEEEEEEGPVKAVSMAAPPGLEEMLERVGGGRIEGGKSVGSGSGKWSSSVGGGMRQLSREQQVELMERRRQSLPILVGRRQSSSGVIAAGGMMESSGPNGMVVTELKEVLNVLKSKSKTQRIEQVRLERD